MLIVVSLLSCIGIIGAVFGRLGVAFGTQARLALAAGALAEARGKAESALQMFFLCVVLTICIAIFVAPAVFICFGAFCAVTRMPVL